MEEAKFSANVKFKYQGFECQFTMRQDEGPAAGLMQLQLGAVGWLQAHGAVPSNGNGNGHQVPAPALTPGKPAPKPEPEAPVAPVCPTCGLSDELELVHFERAGKPRDAFKCQRCQKWLPDKK